ncbi:hypothetical protein ABZU45_10615 [Streptomyces avermitilis]|uniref:hypothetical protein n=1 Tax=Streptomyces avermitilis TaxID=33903 RepID=UPI00339FCAB9
MTPEALSAVLLLAVGGVLRLAGDMVRRHAARATEEARARMLVDLVGHCGPDAVLVDRRSGGAVLTVRSGTAATQEAAARQQNRGEDRG